MRELEYKTVAMPQVVRGRRRRRQTRAEMIAETLSAVINKQSEAGWSYVRADTFQANERKSWFHTPELINYTVLVFSRPVASLEPKALEAEVPKAIEDKRRAAVKAATAARKPVTAEVVDPPQPTADKAVETASETASKPEDEPSRQTDAAFDEKKPANIDAAAKALAALRASSPLFKGGNAGSAENKPLLKLPASEAAKRLINRAAPPGSVRRTRRTDGE
ncbi:MAG: hypothetical protein AAF661_07890 [Pseudomonadota bacterium]